MKFFHLNLRLPLAVLLAPNAVAAGDHVIIIGAGAAGMSAAKTLLELDSSVNITILEATDRIGGRVKTEQLGDTRVEMGAEEHYGPKVDYDRRDNPIYEALTTKYGKDIYTDADSFSTVYAMPPSPNSTCGTISYGSGTGLAKNCADDSDWKKFIGIYDWYWKPSTFQKNKTQTVEYALSQSSTFFKGIPNYKNTRGWFCYNNDFGGEFGTTVDKLGAHDLAVTNFEWPLSDYVLLNTYNGGYSDVLDDTWWKDTVSKVTLKLNSPVTQVNTTSNLNSPVEVLINSGEKLSAKYVIVTASIGVLKESIKTGSNEGITFNPALPPNTKKAIADIGFDQGMKVALKFDPSIDGCNVTGKPWWHTAAGGEVSWMVSNGMSGGWSWASNYKDGSRDQVYMTFIMGDNAKKLSDLNNDTKIVEQILDDLDRMFANAPASKCFGSIHPDKYIIQNWGKSKYTRGAYSFQTPTTVDNNGTAYVGNARVRLQEPVQGRRIFFAGEGTSLIMGSTVPGAVFEGQRVANAVKNSLSTRRNALESAEIPIRKRTVRASSTPTPGTNLDVSVGKNGVHDNRGKYMLNRAKSRKIA